MISVLRLENQHDDKTSKIALDSIMYMPQNKGSGQSSWD